MPTTSRPDEGKPQVTDIVGVGRPEGKVLSLAAVLETGSSHPLAVTILARARANKVPVPPTAKAIAGKGVSGKVGGEEVLLASPSAAGERVQITPELQATIDGFNEAGKTVSVLIVGTEIAGIFAIRDEPRDDAVAGIQALQGAGIGIVMLTGDNERSAKAIGSKLGIEVRASLLPEDKQRIVLELQSQSKVMAKVGDGITDAPALAAADIGIAMGGGTDVALETADAAVLHGRVLDIAGIIDLSKATMGAFWRRRLAEVMTGTNAGATVSRAARTELSGCDKCERTPNEIPTVRGGAIGQPQPRGIRTARDPPRCHRLAPLAPDPDRMIRVASCRRRLRSPGGFFRRPAKRSVV